jgi:ferric-dicitrate binding protein FerR (iron transport regulator)
MLINRNIETDISNYLAGECDASEKLVISGLIQSDPDYRAAYAEMKQIWENAVLHSYSDTYDVDAAWKNVNRHMVKKPLKVIHRQTEKMFFTWRFQKYAAGIAAILLVGFSLLIISRMNKPLKTFASGIAQTGKLTLSDGSKLTLNAGSKINYPEKFGSHDREVYLWGEAFFEIASDPDRPFVIETGDTRIKVLGTSFNVKANPGSEITEVVVSNGTVLFYHVDKNEDMLGSLVLHAGEKGIYEKSTGRFSKTTNFDPGFNNWKTGVLVFNETTLDKVFEVLGKKYNVSFHMYNPELAKLKLTATFDSESLGSVLEVLRLVHKLQFTTIGKDYLVRKTAG